MMRRWQRQLLALTLTTLIALAWASPAVAGVLYNSTSDRLTAASFTVPQSAGTLCWDVYPFWAQSDGAGHTFFSIMDSVPNNRFIAQKFNDNSLYVGWVTSTTNYRVVVATANYTLNQNAWNSFCVTWDDTANETKLYLNGSQIGTTVTSLVTWSTAAETWVVGNQRSDVSSENLDGRLAEIAIWNRVLNSTERGNRLSGLVASCIPSGLVDYWPLTSTSDLTDHAGSFTLTNANVTDASNHPTTSGCTSGPVVNATPLRSLVGGGLTP